MFSIFDGRKEFYRWDINQKVKVNDASIKEVHFCNRTDDCSLVTEVYELDGERVADVPNILLHQAKTIRVYGYTGEYTLVEARFRVNERTKPTDYVYTETEVKSWDSLNAQVGYYLPSIDASGYINWSASKASLPDAPSAYIKGDKGDKGDKGEAGLQAVILSDDISTAYTYDFGSTYNHETRLYNDIDSISFVFSDGEYSEDYMSSLIFNSGEVATAIDYSGSGILNWVGTDCATVDSYSIFQPSANTHYEILFSYNGTQFVGFVYGFVPASA